MTELLFVRLSDGNAWMSVYICWDFEWNRSAEFTQFFSLTYINSIVWLNSIKFNWPFRTLFIETKLTKSLFTPIISYAKCWTLVCSWIICYYLLISESVDQLVMTVNLFVIDTFRYAMNITWNVVVIKFNRFEGTFYNRLSSESHHNYVISMGKIFHIHCYFIFPRKKTTATQFINCVLSM